MRSAMEPDRWDLLIKYWETHAEKPNQIGLSEHLLVVCLPHCRALKRVTAKFD